LICLTQWLCPSRHCSIAMAWDPSITTEQAIIQQGESLYDKGLLHRCCGLCGGLLHVETGETAFRNLDEAAPPLEVVETANLYTRRLIRQKRN